MYKSFCGNFDAMANGKLLEVSFREIGVSEKQNYSANTYHFVNAGDTLYSLAKQFNILVDDIKKWNNLTDNIIVTGQSLRVAQTASTLITESKVLQYANECGFKWITSENDAWCSVWLNAMCKRAGLPMSGSPAARSWLDVGTPTESLNDADVVVYHRDGVDSIYGHCGIPASYTEDKQYIHTLGGNQSNSVSLKPYPVSRLLGLRKLI